MLTSPADIPAARQRMTSNPSCKAWLPPTSAATPISCTKTGIFARDHADTSLSVTGRLDVDPATRFGSIQATQAASASRPPLSQTIESNPVRPTT